MGHLPPHRGLSIGDALQLEELWGDLPSPRAIVTSPPYLDMHDYGNTSQIGVRGQPLDEYLDKMTALFRDCYVITTDDATFWLVAGAIRRDGRLIPLPDRLVACAEEAGWTLREAITWDKQKALPWTHHGELRDVTEQVLLFSKADVYRFDATDLRSPIPNSIWWRRYPERYSPDGYLPTNLWSIPIPTQGSWSGVRTHFCPFPEELTYRMLKLTTDEGDLVLDPLAGIGSIPAMAEATGRVGYGLELTPDYALQYEETVQSARRFVASVDDDSRRRAEFRRIILELRLLKYAKLLGQRLCDAGVPVSWVRVKKSRRQARQAHHVISADFELVLADQASRECAQSTATGLAQKPPLSKFGIDAGFAVRDAVDAARTGHWFASGRFWNGSSSERPTGGEPHVVARFKPDPDKIDDTPYA